MMKPSSDKGSVASFTSFTIMLAFVSKITRLKAESRATWRAVNTANAFATSGEKPPITGFTADNKTNPSLSRTTQPRPTTPLEISMTASEFTMNF
ncbi:hypothetical protein ACOSP7_022612 [Xanthoceras sorbifolium]